MQLPAECSGRAFVYEGVTYYSPNCLKVVPVPPHRDDNVYRFQETDCRHFNFVNPEWWSPIYGWLSFVPTTTKLPESQIFESFLVTTAVPVDIKGDWWGIGPERLKKWEELEDILCHCILLIARMYNFHGFLKPSPMNSLQPESRRHNLTCADQFVTGIRDWIFMWIGMLSFMVARTTATNRHWSITLAKEGIGHSILDQLEHSTVCDFSDECPQAGIFIDSLAPRHGRPKIEFFVKHHVPVWYIWSPEHARVLLKEENICTSLLPSQAEITRAQSSYQAPISGLPRMPPCIGNPNETRESRKKKLYLATKPWECFFKNRAKENIERERCETEKARQTRLNRQRNPPKTRSTNAYVWDWDENSEEPKLVRTKITLKELKDHYIPDYEEYQKKYCAFTNTWDICEYFDRSSDDSPEVELANAEFEDEMNNTTWQFPLQQQSSPLPQVVSNKGHDAHERINANRPIHVSLTNVVARLTTVTELSIEPTEFPLQWNSSSLLSCLYYRHGFLVSNDRHETTEEDASSWHQVMGALSRFNDTPISIAAGAHRDIITFVESLKHKKKPPTHLYDLDSANPAAILKEDFWIMFERKGMWLLVRRSVFDNLEVDAWQLAVSDITDAIFLYRLLSSWVGRRSGEQISRQELVKHLLDLCIPFHTFDTDFHCNLMSVHCMVPYRLHDHVFSLTEYRNYINMRNHFLLSDRGRAALLAGGIVARLARDVIGIEEAMSGPSIRVTEYGVGVTYEENNRCYSDDKLTKDEMNLICGVFHTPTGQGTTTTHFSWWPPQHHWMQPMQAGINCRYWSEHNEDWYQKRTADLAAGRVQPRSATQWSIHIKGFRPSIRIAETTSQLAADYLQGSS